MSEGGDMHERLEKAALAIGLTEHLEAEASYYRFEVERDYSVSLGEFLDEWHDRHLQDPSAGWLDRKSLEVVRRAYIDARIAISSEELDGFYFERQSTGGKGSTIWFRRKGVAYEYEPSFDKDKSQ
jgi:hypothetical protein